MNVTEQDRERAREIIFNGDAGPESWTQILAAALAEERERARAPFLAYADKCAAIGDDRKAGIFKRALNRSIAQAFRRAAEESQ